MRIADSFGAARSDWTKLSLVIACCGRVAPAERWQPVLDKQRGDRGALFGDRLRCLELVDLFAKSLDFGGLLGFASGSRFNVRGFTIESGKRIGGVTVLIDRIVASGRC